MTGGNGLGLSDPTPPEGATPWQGGPASHAERSPRPPKEGSATVRLESHGFRVELPAPWEGAVVVGELDAATRRRAQERGTAVHTPPALHLATFALPPVRGDFGSGAVDVMAGDDVFVALVEYGPESLGTPLFARAGLPRRLEAGDFRSNALQRWNPGQAGLQVFCTEAGRPLSLYVVLGGTANTPALARQASAVLAGLEVEPA